MEKIDAFYKKYIAFCQNDGNFQFSVISLLSLKRGPPKSAQKPRGASPFAAKPRGVMFGRIYPAGKRPSAKRSSSARLSALPPFSALAAPAPARRWTSSQPASDSAKTTEQSSPRPRNSSAPPGAASVRCSSSSRLAKKPERQSRDRGAPRTVHPTVGAKPRYQHRGKQMRKGNHLLLPLGSPARGAVAAQRAVTEGLAPTRAGRANLTRQPTPGGRGSPPLRRVGRCARGTNAVGRPAKGASRTPPLRWLRDIRCGMRCKGRAPSRILMVRGLRCAGLDSLGGSRRRSHRGRHA